MLPIRLSQSELRLLHEIRLNSIADRDLQLAIYHLQLLADDQTGDILIPGEVLDQLRDFTIRSEEHHLTGIILAIFSRTLGTGLDLGFFD